MKKGILVLGISLLFCSLGVVGTTVKAESNEFNATTVLAGNKEAVGAKRAAVDIDDFSNNVEIADVSAYVSDVKVQADTTTKSLRFVAAIKAEQFWADGTATVAGEYGFVMTYVKDGESVQRAYTVENYYHSIASAGSYIVNEHSTHAGETGVSTVADTFGADYNLMIALTVEGLTGYEDNLINVAPYVKLTGESVYKFYNEEPKTVTLNQVLTNATHMLYASSSSDEKAWCMKYNSSTSPAQYEVTGVTLTKGDTISIYNNDTKCTIVYENPEYTSGFTAPRDGSYDFYYKKTTGNKLWITTPAQVNTYVVNDGTEVKMTGMAATDVALNSGDTVKVYADGELICTEEITTSSEYTITVDGTTVSFIDENETVVSYVVTLVVNSNWATDSPRFAAYLYGGTGNDPTWVNMTKSATNTYYVDLAEYTSFTNIIFCRMNPNASANNWDNKWNQTGDLVLTGNFGKTFTVPAGAWDGSTTGWSA